MAKKGRLKLGDKVKFAYWTEEFCDRGVVIGLFGDEVVLVQDGGDGSSISVDRRGVKRL